MSGVPLFLREDFRRTAGPALRPGGVGLTARALDFCRLPAGALVADIGCGCGASLALLTGTGLRAVGVDASPDLLAQAAGCAPRAVLVRGQARYLPLADKRCAAVLCECVLSVTDDPLAALVEMRRIVRPGGFLICSDVFLRSPAGCAIHRAAGCAAGAVSEKRVRERFRRAGFAIRLFEDHSRELARLAGQLLFSGVSRDALGACGQAGGRPGYYLCVAQAE